MFEKWWSLYSRLCCKFTVESASERIFKIGQYLVKLLTDICGQLSEPPCRSNRVELIISYVSMKILTKWREDAEIERWTCHHWSPVCCRNVCRTTVISRYSSWRSSLLIVLRLLHYRNCTTTVHSNLSVIHLRKAAATRFKSAMASGHASSKECMGVCPIGV